MNISISSRVTPEIKASLKTYSDINSISMSEVIRRALESYLEQPTTVVNNTIEEFTPSLITTVYEPPDPELEDNITTIDIGFTGSELTVQPKYKSEFDMLMGVSEIAKRNNLNHWEEEELIWANREYFEYDKPLNRESFNSDKLFENAIFLQTAEVPELTEEYLASFEKRYSEEEINDKDLEEIEQRIAEIQETLFCSNEGMVGVYYINESIKEDLTQIEIEEIDGLILTGVLNAYRIMHFEYLNSEYDIIQYCVLREFKNNPELIEFVSEKLTYYDDGITTLFDNHQRMEYKELGKKMDTNNSWSRILK